MIKQFSTILRQMGPRYVGFRAWYEIRKRTGLLRHAFPTSFAPAYAPELSVWKADKPKFLTVAREETLVPVKPTPGLKVWYDRFVSGEFQYFNYEWKTIGREYDWLNNPTTDYTYALNHWTEIPDLDPEKGDVKYVWEKSRFSYLITLIRYDHHFKEDQSELVFSEIDSWLKANPLNLGPNYLCSQEISLRLLNWIFALYYYQNSTALTQERWKRIMQSVYGQLKHIRANIHFSRIAVRNNHAITETLMLYVGGLLFPEFPEATEWKEKGKAWFEEEITYQVYEDGTYIQHSHNYQRVLTQLLSYAYAIAGANGENFTPVVRQRALASLQYLFDCSHPDTGELPNYGSNDGALFFPLATQGYRDYRPQLNGLCSLLNGQLLFPGKALEEAEWLNGRKFIPSVEVVKSIARRMSHVYGEKGIYQFRTKDSFTFLNCGSYRDRPFHADNLHLDVWIDDVNILRDAGTYRYNTDVEKMNFFAGSAGHNTVMLANNDQMLKAGRFIWLTWSSAVKADYQITDTGFSFAGKISAFGYLSANISHRRDIVYSETDSAWSIEDYVTHDTDNVVVQHWNLHPQWEKYIIIAATDANGEVIAPEFSDAWFSGHYGELSNAPHLTFTSSGKCIRTRIKRIN